MDLRALGAPGLRGLIHRGLGVEACVKASETREPRKGSSVGRPQKRGLMWQVFRIGGILFTLNP